MISNTSPSSIFHFELATVYLFEQKESGNNNNFALSKSVDPLGTQHNPIEVKVPKGYC